MTDAAYVVTGWALTGLALVGYTIRIVLRSHRADEALPDEEHRPWQLPEGR